MSITVHHLESSRSQRILWLLEELGLSYEVRRYQRHPRTMLAPPALKQVHPLGKAPVIQDGDITLAETGAIVEYLVEKAGSFLGPPADAVGALRYRHFLHYAEGSLMPPLFTDLVLGRVPLLGSIARRKFRPMIDVHLDYVETELTHHPWFAGKELTAADVMMSYPLEAAATRVGGSRGRPHIAAWIERIKSRPAYRKASLVGLGSDLQVPAPDSVPPVPVTGGKE
jgi:glutathione S-transferase